MKKRSVSLLAAMVAVLAGVSSGVGAQSFPIRPVNMVVPYAAGGSADVVGRLVATEMAKVLGQNVIIDMRPGAGATSAPIWSPAARVRTATRFARVVVVVDQSELDEA